MVNESKEIYCKLLFPKHKKALLQPKSVVRIVVNYYLHKTTTIVKESQFKESVCNDDYKSHLSFQAVCIWFISLYLNKEKKDSSLLLNILTWLLNKYNRDHSVIYLTDVCNNLYHWKFRVQMLPLTRVFSLWICCQKEVRTNDILETI